MKRIITFLFACNSILFLQAAIPQTPALVTVARAGDLHRVKELLQETGINLNERDAFDLTPLLAAIQNGHTDVVDALLEAGADPNKLGSGYSPLGMAAQEGNKDIVALLLAKKNTQLNIQGFLDFTPLQLAASNGHKDIVLMLLDADAGRDEASITDEDIAIAGRMAKEAGHKDIANLFMTPVKSASKQ